MVAASALRRLATADEVASDVNFLCSTCAALITGTDMLVGGGSVASITHSQVGDAFRASS